MFPCLKKLIFIISTFQTCLDSDFLSLPSLWSPASTHVPPLLPCSASIQSRPLRDTWVLKPSKVFLPMPLRAVSARLPHQPHWLLWAPPAQHWTHLHSPHTRASPTHFLHVCSDGNPESSLSTTRLLPGLLVSLVQGTLHLLTF